MGIKDDFVKGLTMLKPPNGESTDKAVQYWRWYVASLLGATSLTLAGHIVLTWGLIPAIYPGFANAGDFNRVQVELKSSRIADIGARILDIRAKQCNAAGDVRALYLDSLQKMLIEYNNLTDKQYPLPDCTDFRT